MIQQISCGKLTEPISFSYDDLTSDYYADLEIFSDGSQSGLLIISDYGTVNKGKLFDNEAVEIPVYDECTSEGFLVFDENEAYRTETLYQINTEKKSTMAVR